MPSKLNLKDFITARILTVLTLNMTLFLSFKSAVRPEEPCHLQGERTQRNPEHLPLSKRQPWLSCLVSSSRLRRGKKSLLRSWWRKRLPHTWQWTALHFHLHGGVAMSPNTLTLPCEQSASWLCLLPLLPRERVFSAVGDIVSSSTSSLSANNPNKCLYYKYKHLVKIQGIWAQAGTVAQS